MSNEWQVNLSKYFCRIIDLEKNVKINSALTIY